MGRTKKKHSFRKKWLDKYAMEVVRAIVEAGGYILFLFEDETSPLSLWLPHSQATIEQGNIWQTLKQGVSQDCYWASLLL